MKLQINGIIKTFESESITLDKLIDQLGYNSKIIVVEGTVYPLLNRLKKLGYIQHVWRESNQGPPRKYYSITYQGTLYLNKLIISWNELEDSLKKLMRKNKSI